MEIKAVEAVLPDRPLLDDALLECAGGVVVAGDQRGSPGSPPGSAGGRASSAGTDPAVDVDPVVAAWGEFVSNTINVSKAGALQADAVRLMDRAGYR